MKIDKELIEKVEKISRLKLTEEEKQEFLPEFKEILESFSKLKEASTDKVEPSFQPIEIKDRYREDKIEQSLSQEEALKNTKNKQKGFFKGPRAI